MASYTNSNMNTNVNVNTSNLFNNCERYMHLTIFVDSKNDDLKNKYIAAAAVHNLKMSQGLHPDAGFDLFVPDETVCSESQMNKINFQVKCAAHMVCESGKQYVTGFYMYPRSSLSKTTLRLANSVGIIDSGYRGSLIGAFDCRVEKFIIYAYDKLVQICAPGLVPVYVYVVFSEEELGEETLRGAGGFGSTG